MKKFIPKAMLAIALIFFITFWFVFFGVLTDNIRWGEGSLIAMLASIAVSGLFLWFYRVLDILENKE